MSLKCNCKSILGVIDSSKLSTTKIKVIKKLCKKNIPMPIKFNEYDFNICPVCKKNIKSDDNYCFNCGQRIFLD